MIREKIDSHDSRESGDLRELEIRVIRANRPIRAIKTGVPIANDWDKPGFYPYSTQWKPDFTGFVPGTNPVCPWDNPGDEGRHRKFCDRSLCAFFAR